MANIFDIHIELSICLTKPDSEFWIFQADGGNVVKAVTWGIEAFVDWGQCATRIRRCRINVDTQFHGSSNPRSERVLQYKCQ